VDSLSTLAIMGLHEEFAEAQDWVTNNLDFEKDNSVSLFEITIRLLGGLMSAFHLSGERIFLEKAEDLACRLLPSLQKESVIPPGLVNLLKKHPADESGRGNSLAEVASLQLEFRAIGRALNNATYEQAAFRISEHIHRIGCAKHDGLCPMILSMTEEHFEEPTILTFGARSDSFYEYLLKQWLQTGKTIDWLIDDYTLAMDGMYKKLYRLSKPSGLGFVGELLGGDNFSPKMDHLACFLAGTLALGASNGLPQLHMELAKNLSYTCFKMYDTTTGLAPEIAHFNTAPGSMRDILINQRDSHWLMRPEAIESWFYMHRITGERQYQDWGWRVFQAIERHAKIATGGYSSVDNVKRIPVMHRDMMESFFLSETLKYLYLLLGDDQTLIPLDEYVFNTEAHPLPIYFA